MRRDAEDDYAWLFRAYFRRIAQTVNMIVGDRARAEEVTQDAFVQLWRKWSSVSGYERPEAWVRRVAVRLAIRSAQRESRRRFLERAGRGEEPESFPDPDLARAVAALAPMQRAAVVLFYLDDRPVADVARTLGVSESTVKQHLFRARRRLAEALGEPEVDHVG